MGYFLWSYHIRDNSVDKLQSIQNSSWFFEKNNIQSYYTLSTCNRVEILVYSKEAKLPKNIYPQLKVKHYSDPQKIISHLLKVSLSIDSVVFGENQILGQMKKALATQESHVGGEINKLLQLIFRESKLIRHQTELSRFQTSISSVAAKYIQNEFKNKNTKILLVGFGETNQLVLKSLEKKKYNNISITNRTEERVLLQKRTPLSWKKFLSGQIENYDVLCFATSSPKKILTAQILKSAKPKSIIDLCLPSNADKKLVIKNKISYLGLDEIQKTLKANEKEVLKIKKQLAAYLNQSIEKIVLEISAQKLNTYISEKIQEFERIHLEAQKDLNSIFNNLTEDQIKAVASWSSKLAKKINHLHLSGYKEAFQIGFKKDDPANRNTR